MALTTKQQAFVNEYMIDFNATQAAIRAGYSERTARQQGHRLLTNVDISEDVKLRVAERAMSADEVLIRLSEQARADFGPYVSEFGTLDWEKLKDDGKTHLVKKYKVERLATGNLKIDIEGYDAQAALVQLGRVHGLFTDKTEVSGPDGDPIPIAVVNKDLFDAI